MTIKKDPILVPSESSVRINVVYVVKESMQPLELIIMCLAIDHWHVVCIAAAC